MKKLWTYGRLHIDLIERALLAARRKGELPNVPTNDIDDFVKGLEETIKDNPKVGSQITGGEAEVLFRKMLKIKTDKISDSELETIKKIVTDKDFAF